MICPYTIVRKSDNLCDQFEGYVIEVLVFDKSLDEPWLVQYLRDNSLPVNSKEEATTYSSYGEAKQHLNQIWGFNDRVVA